MSGHRLLTPLFLLMLPACNELLGIEDRNLSIGGGGSGGSDGVGAAGGGMTAAGGGTGGAGGSGGEELPCLLQCASGCVEPFTSDEHCGRCDHACEAGSACLNGICDRRLRTNPSSYTQCVRSDSGLACWGDNDYGQHGDGTFQLADGIPATPVSATPSDQPGLFAASAIRSTCAVTAGGRLLCFGQNQQGSLGIGPGEGGPDDGASPACCHHVDAVAPLVPADVTIVDIAGGGWWERNEFYCALASDGDVYCWGNGADIPLKKIAHAVQIEAGIASACALLDSGEVWCWIPPLRATQDNSVALGIPFRVEGLPAIRAIGMAHEVGYAVDADGGAWAWGPSAYGLLGPGTPLDANIYYPPRSFGHTFEAPIVQVTGTRVSACALLASGDVYCWGKNGWQGDGTAQNGGYDPAPRKAFTESILEIAASNHEIVARHTSGQILRWSNAHPTPAALLLP